MVQGLASFRHSVCRDRGAFWGRVSTDDSGNVASHARWGDNLRWRLHRTLAAVIPLLRGSALGVYPHVLSIRTACSGHMEVFSAKAKACRLTIHSSRTRAVASRLRLTPRAGRLNSGVRCHANYLATVIRSLCHRCYCVQRAFNLVRASLCKAPMRHD